MSQAPPAVVNDGPLNVDGFHYDHKSITPRNQNDKIKRKKFFFFGMKICPLNEHVQ